MKEVTIDTYTYTCIERGKKDGIGRMRCKSRRTTRAMVKRNMNQRARKEDHEEGGESPVNDCGREIPEEKGDKEINRERSRVISRE